MGTLQLVSDVSVDQKSVHKDFEHTSAAITAAKAPPWLEATYRSINKKKEDKISHLNPKTPYSRSKRKVSVFNHMKETLKSIMQVEIMRRTSNLCAINKPRITSIEALSPSALASLYRHHPRGAMLGSGTSSNTASESGWDEVPDSSEGKSICGASTKTII